METLLTPALLVGLLLGALVVVLRAARRRPARSRALPRLLAALAAALLGYLAVEACFVLFVDTTDVFVESRISRRWFARHAGPPNSLGMRDRDHPPGPVPVVVLGDSFVWGNGVADRAARVSERLQERLGGRRVANCSRPGSGTTEQLALYERLVARHGPPDALVHVYVWNDMAPAPDEPRFERGQLGRLFHAHSYSLDFLDLHLRSIFDAELRAYSDRVAARYDDAKALEVHAAELLAVEKAARRDGTRYLVVGWPFHLETDRYDRAYAWLAGHLAARGVEYLDLRPVFAGHARADLVVGRLDHHPGPVAHDLAAAAIAARLEALGPDLAR